MIPMSFRRAAILALAGILPFVPTAGRAQSEPAIPPGKALRYTVFKDGDPIGGETLTFQRDGATTRVAVVTDTLVKILFLDFHYHHVRTETWTGNALTHLVADTDDDGTRHHVETSAGSGGIEGQADGHALSLPATAFPLTVWNEAALTHPVLYDIVDAASYRVQTADLGADTLTLDGKTVATHHYRLSGDIDRDLWYGDDGFLERVDFKSHGFPITVLRQQP